MNDAIPDQHLEVGDMPLELGGCIPCARLAYVTLGTLNPAGDNAIMILHGYTSSHRFVLPNDPDNAEGSWGPLIGPSKIIDTDRYFVVSPNALGSSYGSSGPGDINPATGKIWGPDFPALTVADQVNAQSRLLDALGVSKLYAVIGLSMGGFGAFQWAVQQPDRVTKVIPVLTAPWGSLNKAASHQSVTAVLEANAAWHGGWYHDDLPQIQQTLVEIRHKTLARYGVPAWLTHQLQDPGLVQDRLNEMATYWATRFDAHSLLTLRAAINRFDVRAQLGQAQADLLYVLCRTDSLFPPSIAPETMDRWPNAKQRAKYVEINSEYGHFASSLDWQRWADALEAFLNTR